MDRRPESFATYDGAHPTVCGKETSLATLESCLLNAELVYQGSSVEPSDTPAIPELFAAVDHDAVEAALQDLATNPDQGRHTAYQVWTELIDHGAEPTHKQLTEVLAGLQHVGLRDQILADMPGINEPMAATLFGATDEAPQWDGNYMHLALTFDPDYHLARLLDQMLGTGVVSGWAQHKNTAYRNQH